MVYRNLFEKGYPGIMEYTGMSLDNSAGKMDDDGVRAIEMSTEIGERIKSIRMSKHMTQQDIEVSSRKMARNNPELEVISRPYISQLEQGKFGNMTLKRLTSLLTILDAAPEEIGIQLNLNRKSVPINSSVIRVPPGVPEEIVENVRRMLTLISYGAQVERKAFEDVSKQLYPGK